MVSRLSGSGPVTPPDDIKSRSTPFVKAMRQFSADWNSTNPDLDRIARDMIETYNRAIEAKA